MTIADVLSPAQRAELARIATPVDPERDRLEAAGWIFRAGAGAFVRVAEHRVTGRKHYAASDHQLVEELTAGRPS